MSFGFDRSPSRLDAEPEDHCLQSDIPISHYQSAQTSHNPVLASGRHLRQKKGPGEKTALRRIRNSGVICCARSRNQNGNPG